jgi:hypothetical protein
VDQVTLLRKVAAKWREAAATASHRELEKCYLKRAKSYEAKAAEVERQRIDGTDPAGGRPLLH